MSGDGPLAPWVTWRRSQWCRCRKMETDVDRMEKREFVAELSAVFAETSMVVVTRNAGMTVAEVTDLRRKMRAAGATFKVAKNRLASSLWMEPGSTAFAPAEGADRACVVEGPGSRGESRCRVRQDQREVRAGRWCAWHPDAGCRWGQGAGRTAGAGCAACQAAGAAQARQPGSQACFRRRPDSSHGFSRPMPDGRTRARRPEGTSKSCRNSWGRVVRPCKEPSKPT